MDLKRSFSSSDLPGQIPIRESENQSSSNEHYLSCFAFAEMEEDGLPIPTERFISLIEERPNLWNRFSSHYKNKIATQNSWREILLNLYPDFDTWDEMKRHDYAKRTIKKWTYIRDTFFKSEKKIQRQKMSGNRVKPAKRYIYHRELSFLKNIPQRKVTVSKTTRPTVETKDEACTYAKFELFNDSTIQNNEAPVQPIEPPIIQNKTKLKRKSKLSAKNAAIIKFMDSLASPVEPINRHSSFFNGLIPTLDRFDDDQTIEFQLGVLQLIKEIKNNSSARNHAAHQDSSSTSYAYPSDGRPVSQHSQELLIKSYPDKRSILFSTL